MKLSHNVSSHFYQTKENTKSFVQTMALERTTYYELFVNPQKNKNHIVAGEHLVIFLQLVLREVATCCTLQRHEHIAAS